MDPATIFLWLTMMLITLAMGLGLTLDDFRRIAAAPRAVAIGSFGQLVALPSMGFAIALLFGLPPALAVGLVLIAACPGGTHSNLFAGLAGADVALSITLTAVSGLASVITIPLWVGLATAMFTDGQGVSVDVGRTMLGLGVVIALPTVVGVGMRHRAPAAAMWLRRVAGGLGVALLLLIVVGAVAANGELVTEHARTVGAPVVALNLATMALGGGMARLGRLPRDQQLTIVLEVGIQNSALGYGIAMGMLGDLSYAIPGIVYSLWVYIAGGLVVWAARR